jgi:hypothetical protein
MGAKEKPGFMVRGNRILFHFSMSFAVGLGFSAVAYSLCAAYLSHGKKNGIYCRFSYGFFTVGYFLLNWFFFLSLFCQRKVWICGKR